MKDLKLVPPFHTLYICESIMISLNSIQNGSKAKNLDYIVSIIV